MVGARGFEPPTPWSRTRFSGLLKFVEIRRRQLFWIEYVAVVLWKATVLCGFRMLWPLQFRLHFAEYQRSRSQPISGFGGNCECGESPIRTPGQSEVTENPISARGQVAPGAHREGQGRAEYLSNCSCVQVCERTPWWLMSTTVSAKRSAGHGKPPVGKSVNFP